MDDSSQRRKKRAAPSNTTVDAIPKHIKYKIRVDIDNSPEIYLKYQE
jgi:hypothetical protein